MIKKKYLPLDGETSHTGLLGKDITLHSLDDGLGRGLCVELLRVVLVVDIVSNPNKLASVVGAGQEHDRDTQNIGVGDASSVGSLSLEEEFVDSDGDWADEKGVELLVILVPVTC